MEGSGGKQQGWLFIAVLVCCRQEQNPGSSCPPAVTCSS